MAARCSVCKHEARAEIDHKLADPRTTNEQIARQYQLGRASVSRHRKDHVSKLLRVLQRRVGVIEAEQINGELLRLFERSDEELDRVLSSGTARERSQAIREHRETLALLAKMSFAMSEREPEALSERPDIDDAISKALARRTQSDAAYSPTNLPPMAELEPVADAELID